MSKPLQQYYEDRFDLLAHPGWEDLLQDIQVRIDSIKTIDKVINVEDLYKKQGELNALEWIKSTKEISVITYDQLKAEGEIE